MIINRHHLRSPVDIIETKLGIPQNYKQECIDKIYKIGDSQNQGTNVKAIMSSWFLWKETDIIHPLLNRIMDVILVSSKDRENLTLSETWSAIYKKNHYTISHSHVPSYISFVYYLQSSGNTPLVFDNMEFSLKPIDDTLIIFPGYLNHSVPSHNDEKDRICVAGNIGWKKILNQEQLTEYNENIYLYNFNNK